MILVTNFLFILDPIKFCFTVLVPDVVCLVLIKSQTLNKDPSYIGRYLF